MGLCRGGGRDSPRRATHFSLSRQRKVSQRKATPLCVSLRFAAGNLRCSRNGGGPQTRFAQYMRPADPRFAALLGTPRGGPGTRDQRAMARPCVWVRPSGIQRAERSNGPSHALLGVPRSAAFRGSGPRVSERSKFARTPRKASTAGRPARSAGTPTAGSPFLCLLSFGEAKESRSPAGTRPGQQPYHRPR